MTSWGIGSLSPNRVEGSLQGQLLGHKTKHPAETVEALTMHCM